jgi:putative hydrolase of the HAD superfamily
MAGLVSEPAIDDWLAYHGELDSEMVALVKASRAT